MKAGKSDRSGILKGVLWTTVTLCVLCLLLFGSFIYVTRYRISLVDSSESPYGKYELLLQQVGDPDWPFGLTHARLILKDENRTIITYPFDVKNDGGILDTENWNVHWEENSVLVTISGEEQSDIRYVLNYNGTKYVETIEDSSGRENESEIDFSHAAGENVIGETVFSVTVEDFIDSYNPGFIEICMIPLTEKAVDILAEEKTAVIDLRESSLRK